jgi:hypothetical protein
MMATKVQRKPTKPVSKTTTKKVLKKTVPVKSTKTAVVKTKAKTTPEKTVKETMPKQTATPIAQSTAAKLSSKISNKTVKLMTKTAVKKAAPEKESAVKKKTVLPAAKPKIVEKKEKEEQTKLVPTHNFPKRPAFSPEGKRRLVVSQKNLSPELQDVMKERFPRGYADYMEQIMRVDKADGTFFYAITLEVEDAIYLVKVDVQIDTDYEDVEKKLFGNTAETDDDGEEVLDSDDENKRFSNDGMSDDE